MPESRKPPDIFSERLRTAREHRKLRQSELAHRARVQASAVSRFEPAGRKPSFDILEKLADVLNARPTISLVGRQKWKDRQRLVAASTGTMLRFRPSIRKCLTNSSKSSPRRQRAPGRRETDGADRSVFEGQVEGRATAEGTQRDLAACRSFRHRRKTRYCDEDHTGQRRRSLRDAASPQRIVRHRLSDP